MESFVRALGKAFVVALCKAPPPLAGVALDVVCDGGVTLYAVLHVAGTKVQVALHEWGVKSV